MSVKTPITLDEWNSYVRQFNAVTVRSQIISANKPRFFQTLQDEGFSIDYCKQILLIFVRRACELGVEVPRGGLYDLKAMAGLDPYCRKMIETVESEDVEEETYEDFKSEEDDFDRQLKQFD